jgi:uncharacterized membrane protein
MNRFTKILFLYAAVFCLMTIPVFLITRRSIHLYFAWNIILAMVPLVVSILFVRHYKSLKGWMRIGLLVLWIFFLPNTFYVITDFIHLQSSVFYTFGMPYTPIEYVKKITDWISLLHIFLAALISLLSGSYSFFLLFEFGQRKWKTPIQLGLIGGISLCSSVGIYIGRFLRFNSWDVLRPVLLIKEVLSSLDRFSLQYILLFFFIHIALIGLFFPLFRGSLSKKSVS